MEAPSDGLLVFTITGRLIIKVIDNNSSNHDYIKILESDWSSAGLISAVIVQLHTSCACNCTVVRVIELALVALEWLLFQHLAQKLNISTCRKVYTTVIFFSNFVIVMIN